MRLQKWAEASSSPFRISATGRRRISRTAIRRGANLTWRLKHPRPEVRRGVRKTSPDSLISAPPCPIGLLTTSSILFANSFAIIRKSRLENMRAEATAYRQVDQNQQSDGRRQNYGRFQ